VQGPELSHVGVRLVAVNGHRDKGPIESGLDGFLGNDALDQGAARGSSRAAILNEHLLLRGLRGSEPESSV